MSESQPSLLSQRLEELDRQIASAVDDLVGRLQEQFGDRVRTASDELLRSLESLRPDLPARFFEEKILDLPDSEPKAAATSSIDAVFGAVARIDGETGQGDLLNALVDEGRQFAGRTAFFLIRGERVRCWSAAGFDNSKLEGSEASVSDTPWSRFVGGQGAMALDAHERVDLAARIESGVPHSAVLLPFVVRGQLAGALYAEQAEGGSLGIRELQLLTHRAAQSLETSAVHPGTSPALLALDFAGDEEAETVSSGEESASSNIGSAVGIAAGLGVAGVAAAAATMAAKAAAATEPAVEEPEVAEPEAAAQEEVEPAAEAEDASQEPAAAANEETSADAADAHEIPQEAESAAETAVDETADEAAAEAETVTFESTEESAEVSPATPAYEEATEPAPLVSETFPADAEEPAAEEVATEDVASEESSAAEAEPEEAAVEHGEVTEEVDIHQLQSEGAPTFGTEAPAEPVAFEPVASEPVASEPVVSEPVASEPAVSEPVATEPATAEPIASEFATAGPADQVPALGFEAAAAPAPEVPDVELAEARMDVTTLGFEGAKADAPEVPDVEIAEPRLDVTTLGFENAPAAPQTPAAAEPPPVATTEPVTEPAIQDPFETSNDIQYAPSPEDIAQEVEPEPELEDTNIWELEEDDEDDEEPTQVGRAAQAETAEPAPEAPPVEAVGQQTVRLDIAALQNQANQPPPETNDAGEDTADVPSWQVEPAAEDASEEESEEPTLMTSAPPSPAGFAAPPTSFAEPVPTSFAEPPPPVSSPPPTSFAPPEPAEEPAAAPAPSAAAGSAEVSPPTDLQGPGLAFSKTPEPEAPTAEDSLHEEARRLARLLVSEIKLYNEEIIEEGRRKGNIYERLKDDIDRSRQMYEERIDPRLADQEDYFHQELVQRLAGGDESLLGM